MYPMVMQGTFFFPQAMNELKNAAESKQFKIDTDTAKAKENAAMLEGKVLKLTGKAGKGGKLFGSVTSKEIAAGLKKEFNIDVDKRKIVLETDIKSFGTFNAEVKLYTGISANVKVMVQEEVN